MPASLRDLQLDSLDIALALLTAAAETAMVAPWLPLLTGLFDKPGAAPSAFGLFVIGLVTFGALRPALAAEMEPRRVRLLGAGLWLVLTLGWLVVGLEPVSLAGRLARGDLALLAIVLASSVAWGRGAMLAAEPDPFDPELARRMIWRGLLIAGVGVAGGALIGGGLDRAVSHVAVVAVPVFLLASLSATALAQARAARAGEHAGRDPLRAGLGSAGMSGLLVLIALLAAVAAVTGVRGQLAQLVHLTIHGILSGGYWLLVALGYVIFEFFPALGYALHALVAAIAWLLSWLPLHALSGKQPKTPPKKLPPAEHVGGLAALVLAFKIAVVVLIVAVILWLALRSLRRVRRRHQRPVGEQRGSVWSRELAASRLRGLFDGLRLPHSRRARRLDLDAEPRDVRDAYAHLLVLAARSGQARLRRESPADLAERLRQVWPPADVPLRDLTTRYLRARYAEVLAEEDTAGARTDWYAIRDETGKDVKT